MVKDSKLNYMSDVECLKKINNVKKEARQKAKLTRCFCCGKECSSFCNSHTVPQFILRNIAENGRLYYWNSISETLFQQEYRGINAAGVFHVICRDCDSQIFREYETPLNYDKQITAKMLAEIDIKNNLRVISKRLVEKEIYKYIKNNYNTSDGINNKRLKVVELDINELKNAHKLAMNHYRKPNDSNYYLAYKKELPYIVPLACQVQIALIVDLEGNIINNTFDEAKKHKIEVMNLCVFPMENKTIVLLFVERKNKKYQRFFKQLTQITTQDDVLKLINYLIFLYTEDFFISPLVSNSILEKLKPVFEKTNQDFAENENILAALQKEKIKFSLRNIPDIPNLLSEDYKIIRNNNVDK